MKTVIMAGGKGTRIQSAAKDVPKPMIPICKKPVLEHQILCLKKQGVREFILVTGYLQDIISDYFGSGRNWDVSISYIREEKPLGTAGGLFLLKEELKEDFLLLNGDIIFDVDIRRFYREHKEKQALVTLFTHPNDHPYDSAIIQADEQGKVTGWLHKEQERGWFKNCVNAGMHLISPVIFKQWNEKKFRDLDRDVLKPMISSGGLYVYQSPEYVKDMGTPGRLKQVEKDLKEGFVERKNLKNRQKAIFLDRDGTLNKSAGFITKPEELALTKDAAKAVKKINRSGYLAIVITNQPVIARGECTINELRILHDKLETLLGNEGAYLDDIFYCPHHPDQGFAGERPEYKIACECRKPRPGLLFKAAEKYNIDLKQSYMIGDDDKDVEAGRNAGCLSYRIDGEHSLLDAVDSILRKEGSYH